MATDGSSGDAANDPKHEDYLKVSSLPDLPTEYPWELSRRWWRSRNRYRGLKYWLLFRGAPLVVAYAALFVVTSFVEGWRNAYDVNLAIESPRAFGFWAWPLSVAGWLAMPSVAGAVAGYVVSSAIDGRRSAKPEDRWIKRTKDRKHRRTILIPCLKQLITQNGYSEIPDKFVPVFIRLVHNDRWREAQDHWELYVSSLLNTDLLAKGESEEESMRRVVPLATKILMMSDLEGHCPVCERRRAAEAGR